MNLKNAKRVPPAPGDYADGIDYGECLGLGGFAFENTYSPGGERKVKLRTTRVVARRVRRPMAAAQRQNLPPGVVPTPWEREEIQLTIKIRDDYETGGLRTMYGSLTLYGEALAEWDRITREVEK